MASIKPFAKAIVLCCIITVACKESTNPPDKIKQLNSPAILSEYLGKPISKSFNGTIIDSENNPLKNVSVTIGNKTAETAINGTFVLTNAAVNVDFVSIKVEKEGYKKNTLNLTSFEIENNIVIILHKSTDPCLFWFCKHNHLFQYE